MLAYRLIRRSPHLLSIYDYGKKENAGIAVVREDTKRPSVWICDASFLVSLLTYNSSLQQQAHADRFIGISLTTLTLSNVVLLFSQNLKRSVQSPLESGYMTIKTQIARLY
jgi:hypothetical protein